MNNKLKRRTFITAVIGTLLGTPVAIRFFRGNADNRKQVEHHFSQELERLRKLMRVPITPTGGPSSVSLALNPPVGQEWKYVVFAPSFLPDNLSHALGDEPDIFLLKEGILAVNQTNSGQVVLTGGDTNSVICSPTHTEKRVKTEIILLGQNGALYPAAPKNGQNTAPPDEQFSHILPLTGAPKELTIGQKWKSDIGRVKPFEQCPTEYEVAGFTNVVGRKTINIRFEGSIPNVAHLRGVNSQPPGKDTSMINTNQGNAYFDLETGLLVRQEVSMTTVYRGQEFANKNGLTVKAHFAVQFFQI